MPRKPAPPRPAPLPQTSLRFSDEDRAKIEDVRQRYGLATTIAAIRFAVHQVWKKGEKA